MRVRPRGYFGTNHETIGSDILAVLQSVKMPDVVLGGEWHERLKGVRPNGWYPIELLLDLLDHLEAKVGPNSVREMGRQLFRSSHQPHVQNRLKSAADLLVGFDAMYKGVNRGEKIGGWRLLKLSPGYGLIEKTTPHLCYLEEGIAQEALKMVQAPSVMTQPQCMQKGADCCVFELHSAVVDHRWMGVHSVVD